MLKYKKIALILLVLMLFGVMISCGNSGANHTVFQHENNDQEKKVVEEFSMEIEDPSEENCFFNYVIAFFDDGTGWWSYPVGDPSEGQGEGTEIKWDEKIVYDNTGDEHPYVISDDEVRILTIDGFDYENNSKN